MKLHTIMQNHHGSWKYHRKLGKYDGIFVCMEFYFYTCQNMVCFCFKRDCSIYIVTPFYLVLTMSCSHYRFGSETS